MEICQRNSFLASGWTPPSNLTECIKSHKYVHIHLSSNSTNRKDRKRYTRQKIKIKKWWSRDEGPLAKFGLVQPKSSHNHSMSIAAFVPQWQSLVVTETLQSRNIYYLTLTRKSLLTLHSSITWINERLAITSISIGRGIMT